MYSGMPVPCNTRIGEKQREVNGDIQKEPIEIKSWTKGGNGRNAWE